MYEERANPGVVGTRVQETVFAGGSLIAAEESRVATTRQARAGDEPEVPCLIRQLPSADAETPPLTIAMPVAR